MNNKIWLALAIAAVATQVPPMIQSYNFNQCVSGGVEKLKPYGTEETFNKIDKHRRAMSACSGGKKF